ncbi:MAG: hypothetical protein MUW56_11620 [Chryseobacterium sp.]|uniref:hypothetical protein n=1 Tax=Chryseobacterium sp. TaxID=1871047 RepID=UPI0025BA33D7|nr:hypothetical protein [Chryseobacterium sp.]MCJ7934256.1 hypothetical protein [Chryseobacterium sp.]
MQLNSFQNKITMNAKTGVLCDNYGRIGDGIEPGFLKIRLPYTQNISSAGSPLFLWCD